MNTVAFMALEKEQHAYARAIESLLPQAGKFVVIGGDNVVGVYDTYSDALTAGYDKCGLEPFLVKQIQVIEQIQFFTRDIAACRT